MFVVSRNPPNHPTLTETKVQYRNCLVTHTHPFFNSESAMLSNLTGHTTKMFVHRRTRNWFGQCICDVVGRANGLKARFLPRYLFEPRVIKGRSFARCDEKAEARQEQHNTIAMEMITIAIPQS
eukprot:3234084-Amphidinium_carterae.3